MKYIYQTVVIVGIALWIAGCKNAKNNQPTSNEEVQEITSNSIKGKESEYNLFDFQFFKLPLDIELYPLVVGNEDADLSSIPNMSKVKFRHLSLIDSELLAQNKLNKRSRSGHYLLDNKGKVIGFSFMPSNSSKYGVAHKGNRQSVLFEPKKISRAFNRYEVVSSKPIDHGELVTLGGLKKIKTIEFVEFGLGGFLPEVWPDLAMMAETGGLRGISIFRGDAFLNVRGSAVLDEIRGVVISLENIENLEQLSSAFPNLEFLCLVVKDRSKIEELIVGDYLRKHFHNLKALMIGDLFWKSSEVDSIAEGREVAKKLRWNPKRIPESLTWLGIDGGLLSLDDMRAYDHLGSSVDFLRMKSGENSGSLKKLEVVYLKFGYSLEAARSMRIGEYFKLEKLWRRRGVRE